MKSQCESDPLQTSSPAANSSSRVSADVLVHCGTTTLEQTPHSARESPGCVWHVLGLFLYSCLGGAEDAKKRRSTNTLAGWKAPFTARASEE